MAFASPRSSLRSRLIFAFLAVAALPMVVATWFAASVVADAFEENIEHWLSETSTFFLRIMDNRRRDARALAKYVLNDTNLLTHLQHGGALPPKEAVLLEAGGLDLLALLDEQGRVLYSNKPVTQVEPAQADGANGLYRVSTAGQTNFMLGDSLPVSDAGPVRQILFGVWLDRDFIDESELVTSMTIRLYYRQGDEFKVAYSTHGSKDRVEPASPAAIRALSQPGERQFSDEDNFDEIRAMYTALRGPNGRLDGVLYCSLGRAGTLSGLVSRQRLFFGVLGFGSLLSIGAALWLSRRLLVPLRALTDGVRAIEEGDYGRTVTPVRQDEFGELALRFNAMSAQLEKLQGMEQQLARQERLGALGGMALGLAHEVRNPLGIILTSAQLLQRRADLTGQHQKLLGYVVDEVRRIETLIAEFMDFANPGSPELRPVSMTVMLARVCDFSAPEFERLGIDCTIDDRSEDARVLGDERQIHQALLNLVLNALQATPAGGQVTLSARIVDRALWVDVSDTGPGVPAELREKIFNPFFTTKDGGTGLGLPKVHAVMTQLGGSVDCLDGQDGGACFRLRFPIDPSVGPIEWETES